MEAVTEHSSSAAHFEGTTPRRRRFVWLIIILLLVGALVALLAIGLQPRTSLLLQGKEAPDFHLTAFNGQFDGQSFSLSALRGKIVVLNMWASWCVECEKEAVVLERAWQDHRARGVWFIGVDYLDTDTAGLEYLRQYGITYPNGPDIGSQIYQAYRCTGVPETFFIDRQGVVQHVQVGPIGQSQLYGLLDRLLAAD